MNFSHGFNASPPRPFAPFSPSITFELSYPSVPYSLSPSSLLSSQLYDRMFFSLLVFSSYHVAYVHLLCSMSSGLDDLYLSGLVVVRRDSKSGLKGLGDKNLAFPVGVSAGAGASAAE